MKISDMWFHCSLTMTNKWNKSRIYVAAIEFPVRPGAYQSTEALRATSAGLTCENIPFCGLYIHASSNNANTRVMLGCWQNGIDNQIRDIDVLEIRTSVRVYGDARAATKGPGFLCGNKGIKSIAYTRRSLAGEWYPSGVSVGSTGGSGPSYIRRSPPCVPRKYPFHAKVPFRVRRDRILWRKSYRFRKRFSDREQASK